MKYKKSILVNFIIGCILCYNFYMVNKVKNCKYNDRTE